MGKTLLAAIAAVAVCVSTSAVMAQEGADAKVIRGTFVKLVEQTIGDQGYLGISVQPTVGEGPVVLLVPMRQVEGKWVRNEDLAAAARALKQGQAVTVAYGEEGDRKIIRRLEAPRAEDKPKLDDRPREGERPPVPVKPREGDAPKAVDVNVETATPDQLRGMVRRLLARVSEMEGTIKGLRAENERLRARAGGEGVKEQPKPAEAAAASAIPEALRGFRGRLVGTIQRKEARSFALEVVRVGELGERNEAKNPQAIVGKTVGVAILPGRGADELGNTLAGMKIGDRVLVNVAPEAGRLVVVETLRKAE